MYPNPLPVAVLALNLEGGDQPDLLLERAARRGALLAVLPFGLPTGLSRDSLAVLARRHALTLVGGFEEEGRRLAVVVSPKGELLGEYAQTHRLPGESFAAGDRLEPIATPLGRLGLSIGSDLYYPEIHWSLVQQGADLLIHLDGQRPVYDHFHSVLSPKVRALDLNRPFILARPTSYSIKLVHNEEMEISGTPLAPSSIFDQNGALLASTGYRSGLALADLSSEQEAQSLERAANIPMTGGNDIWRLYFNDSRERHLAALREPYAPLPKPAWAKRRIRVALISHFYGVQVGSGDDTLLPLLEEACRHSPDIVVLTEMEQRCRPDDPAIAASLEKMVALTRAAGSYLLIGGVRAPYRAEEGLANDGRRSSHGWLWDRTGCRVFESRIMLYGRGEGQGIYDTDFGRIGIRLCGDVYAPELDRLFALQGADIVFNPSMSWGASGLINTELNQVRALDNGHFVASVHLAFSDPGQRSHVIDPNGVPVAASAYYENGVTVTEIDLDAKRGFFVPTGEKREVAPGSYLEGYRTGLSHRLVPQSELLALRRPELYTALESDLPEHPYTTRNRGDGGSPNP